MPTLPPYVRKSCSDQLGAFHLTVVNESAESRVEVVVLSGESLRPACRCSLVQRPRRQPDVEICVSALESVYLADLLEPFAPELAQRLEKTI